MTTTSIGVQELRKRIGEKAKAEPHHRFWGLYTHVWKLDVLDEVKVRRFASRQRPKRRGGRHWAAWSRQEIYGAWKLYNSYRVSWCSAPFG
jgi:hypothetical protein